MNKKQKILLPIILIIFAISTRFLPHPANFTSIGAIAIFGGLYLNKKYALILPLVAMFISDIFIGFYSPWIMASVYVGFILMGVMGLLVRKNKKISTVLAGTIGGSIIFFLLTNAGVWLFGTMYQHNLSGLIQSYTMAIPFFRNSLLGDVFFVGLLVSSYEMVSLVLKRNYKTEKI